MEKNLIPAMTSNTSPSGVASASGIWSTDFDAWNAFDRNNSSSWVVVGKVVWLRYDFEIPTIVDKYSLYTADSVTQAPKDWKFEGSNDGASWNVLDTQTNVTDWSSLNYFEIDNTIPYLCYRISSTNTNGGGNTRITEMGFFKKSVNKFLISLNDKSYSTIKEDVWHLLGMTSNTSPSQYKAESSDNNSNTFRAFNGDKRSNISTSRAEISYVEGNTWIQVDFGETKKVNRLSLVTTYTSTYAIKSFQMLGSYDGSSFEVIDEFLNINWTNDGEEREFYFPKNQKYRFYRLKILERMQASNTIYIPELTFGYVSSTVIETSQSTEQNFLAYGMDKPLELNMTTELSAKSFVEQSPTALGSGKVFKKSIDTSQLPIKKVTIE